MRFTVVKWGIGFFAAIGLCGCSSISIPLGSFFEKKEPEVTTGSITAVLPSAQALKPAVPQPNTRPFSLAASPESIKPAAIAPQMPAPATTGSISANASPFDESDREAVKGSLAQALGQEKPATVPWANKNGQTGLIVPLAEANVEPNCQDILISRGKLGETQWFRSTSCKTGTMWSLGPIVPWRQS